MEGENEKAFRNILEAVINNTENRHFVGNRDKRYICDASRKGIGAALEQKTLDCWATIAYASQKIFS